ncbi:MAG: hypothetical protein H0T92_03495 [Pyrinomonadaceae bacterium]|nr:hypothetical protein [Pyrinomonadaceae bacterium]
MSKQQDNQGGFPQSQSGAQEPYSTTGDGHPPRPGEEAYSTTGDGHPPRESVIGERSTQEGMAGQGTGQMTGSGTPGGRGGSTSS